MAQRFLGSNFDVNRINPEKLLNSKWSAVTVENGEKHFVVTKLLRDQNFLVIECVLEAVLTKRSFQLDWRELKDSKIWIMGWK